MDYVVIIYFETLCVSSACYPSRLPCIDCVYDSMSLTVLYMTFTEVSEIESFTLLPD